MHGLDGGGRALRGVGERLLRNLLQREGEEAPRGFGIQLPVLRQEEVNGSACGVFGGAEADRRRSKMKDIYQQDRPLSSFPYSFLHFNTMLVCELNDRLSGFINLASCFILRCGSFILCFESKGNKT